MARALLRRGSVISFIKAPSARAVSRAAWVLGAGAFLVSACCSDSVVDDIFLIRDADPQLQSFIDRCRDPAQADCLPLCRALIGQPAAFLEHCEMHPDRDGYQQVHVGYRQEATCFE